MRGLQRKAAVTVKFSQVVAVLTGTIPSVLTGTNGAAERGEEAEMGVEKELPSTKLRGGTYECALRDEERRELGTKAWN